MTSNTHLSGTAPVVIEISSDEEDSSSVLQQFKPSYTGRRDSSATTLESRLSSPIVSQDHSGSALKRSWRELNVNSASPIWSRNPAASESSSGTASFPHKSRYNDDHDLKQTRSLFLRKRTADGVLKYAAKESRTQSSAGLTHGFEATVSLPNQANPSRTARRLRPNRNREERDAIVEAHPIRRSSTRRSLRSDRNNVADQAKSNPKGRKDDELHPYLALAERRLLSSVQVNPQYEELQAQLVHKQFSDQEVDAMEPAIFKIYMKRCSEEVVSSISAALMALSSKEPATFLDEISREAGHSRVMRRRDDQSRKAFIKDLLEGNLATEDAEFRLGLLQNSAGSRGLTSLLRQRESVGSARWMSRSSHTTMEGLRISLHDSLAPWRSFTGASSDVLTVAWAPDGDRFAAGAAATADEYNKANNLLLGSISKNTLKELPNHKVIRDKSEGMSAEKYNTLDPNLWTTVSAIDFSADGRLLYSGGYDRTVKVWETHTESLDARCIGSLCHPGEVEVMAASKIHHGTVATGSRVIDDSVRIYRLDESCLDSSTYLPLSSFKATQNRSLNITPSCLSWGLHPSCSTHLLSGFSSVNEGTECEGRMGDICLWDTEHNEAIGVYPHAQNAFDCIWSPNWPRFAVGAAASFGVNKGTRSTVRIYEPSKSKFTKKIECECPAADMNTLTFSPYSDFLVSASCTDRTTYLWDLRNPDVIYNTLVHDDPLDIAKEDCGVRFATWGCGLSRFHTGSSDGIVKSWDPRLAPEDAFIANLAEFSAGVMTGSFTTDFEKLLIGTASGQVALLRYTEEATSTRSMQPMRFVHADSERNIEMQEQYKGLEGVYGEVLSEDLPSYQKVSGLLFNDDDHDEYGDELLEHYHERWEINPNPDFGL